jgi:hypothetical protein
MNDQRRVIAFSQLRMGDVEQVGGKNASLARMTRELGRDGIRVPAGFAVTADAYKLFLEDNKLGARIGKELAVLAAGEHSLHAAGKAIRGLLRKGKIPSQVETQIAAAYRVLAALLHDCGKGAVPVWLRILHVAVPQAGRTLGRQDDAGWRGAAYRLHRHVEISARLVEAAGCSKLTVRLVAGTPTEEEAALAALLYAADDAS